MRKEEFELLETLGFEIKLGAIKKGEIILEDNSKRKKDVAALINHKMHIRILIPFAEVDDLLKEGYDTPYYQKTMDVLEDFRDGIVNEINLIVARLEQENKVKGEKR